MKKDNPFYICKDYYLLIFESKEKATPASMGTTGASSSGAGARASSAVAEYWLKELNSRVTFSYPMEPIFLIEKEKEEEKIGFEFWNVIIRERVGWIIVYDWMNIEQFSGN